VALGVGITAGLTGFGIGAVLAGQPVLRAVLAASRRPGSAGWRCSSGGRGRQRSQRATRHPGASCAQSCSNGSIPKVWAVTLAAASGYGLGMTPWEEAQRLAFAFSGINLFVCLFWAFAGSLLSTLLNDERAWTFFTRVMATGLAVSAVMVIRVNWALYEGIKDGAHMFSRLFHYFETLVDPYTAYPDTDTPPRRLFAFLWDYSQPFKAVFAATAIMSLVVAAIEIGLIWYMGRVVDLLSNGTPAEVLSDHGT
jgi:hypothetical protein